MKKTIDGKPVPGPSTGFNSHVLLDGKPLKGVTFAKVELKPRNIAKVVIELIADIEVDLEEVPVKLK